MPSPFRVEIRPHVRGVYFRKVQSEARQEYVGIRGLTILPHVSVGPDRQFVSKHGLDHFQTGPLDRSSVYMGGHAGGHELDAGLVWDRVYDDQGRATYTDVPEGTDGRDPGRRFIRSQSLGTPAVLDGTGRVVVSGAPEVDRLLLGLVPNFAFRPFWRTTNNDGRPPWNQPRPGTSNSQYFYPSEQVSMRVEVSGPNEVVLEIGLIDPPLEGQITVTFRQIGFGLGGPQAFKRVNSIDQFTVDPEGNRLGLENRDVLPTRTAVTGARWLEVGIIRTDGVVQSVSDAQFIEVRGGDVAPHYDEIFQLKAWNEAGAEDIDITPPAA